MCMGVRDRLRTARVGGPYLFDHSQSDFQPGVAFDPRLCPEKEVMHPLRSNGACSKPSDRFTFATSNALLRSCHFFRTLVPLRFRRG